MGIIQVICVAYKRAIPLRILIDSFMVQTSDRWNLHIIHDGPVPVDVQDTFDLYANDDKVTFYQSQKRLGNYGHPNRKQMLDRLKANPKDFVLMTNDDNYYVPTFVENMLTDLARDTGMVMCNTLHNYMGYDVHDSKPFENEIDMGAFIVAYPVAVKAGFKHTNFSADGRYCVDCAELCRKANLKIKKINKPYFIHN